MFCLPWSMYQQLDRMSFRFAIMLSTSVFCSSTMCALCLFADGAHGMFGANWTGQSVCRPTLDTLVARQTFYYFSFFSLFSITYYKSAETADEEFGNVEELTRIHACTVRWKFRRMCNHCSQSLFRFTLTSFTFLSLCLGFCVCFGCCELVLNTANYTLKDETCKHEHHFNLIIVSLFRCFISLMCFVVPKGFFSHKPFFFVVVVVVVLRNYICITFFQSNRWLSTNPNNSDKLNKQFWTGQ